MKRILFLLVALCITVPSFATMQMSERLIVGRDTLSMFAWPLEYVDSTRRVRLDERLKEADVPVNTAMLARLCGLLAVGERAAVARTGV